MIEYHKCLNCGRESPIQFCTGECKRAYTQMYGIYMSSNGDDINGDGSKDNPYKTVERARESVSGDDYVIKRMGH